MSLHDKQSRLAVHFLRFGPYHLARISSARSALVSRGCDVVGLETAGLDSTYEWKPIECDSDVHRVTVFPGRMVEKIPSREMSKGITQALDRLQPSVVAIAGWSDADALACLDWCSCHRAKAILMSETREADGRRNCIKEQFKSWRVCKFDAALVGGRSHHAYLRKLGFQGPVSCGYDVVDDSFFASEAEHWRLFERDAAHQQRPYLLASNRFIPRKNLPRLIEAFAAASVSPASHTRADLCLLGDGDQRQALEELCAANGLTVLHAAPWDEQASTGTNSEPRVLFPGFRQIEELPRFYAHALVLVHPALAEPWGLVINEAMAAGLPILSSSNVGAAEELLDEGVNGYRFDPTSTDSIALALSRFLALSPEQRQKMGQMSERILADRCPTSSFGEGLRSLLGQL